MCTSKGTALYLGDVNNPTFSYNGGHENLTLS